MDLQATNVSAAVPPRSVDGRLAECRRQARAGDLDGAAARLHTLASNDPHVEVRRLDLLGRVEAQRGHYLLAMAAWQRVLRLEAGHAGATAALATLERRFRPGLLSRRAFSLGILLGIVAVVVAFWQATWDTRERFAALEAAATDVRSRLDRLRVRADEGDSQIVSHLVAIARQTAVAAEQRQAENRRAAEREQEVRRSTALLLGRVDALQQAFVASAVAIAARFDAAQAAAHRALSGLDAAELRAGDSEKRLAAVSSVMADVLTAEIRLASAPLAAIESMLREHEITLVTLLADRGEPHMDHVARVLRQLRALGARVTELHWAANAALTLPGSSSTKSGHGESNGARR